jgi:hypothetical protein
MLDDRKVEGKKIRSQMVGSFEKNSKNIFLSEKVILRFLNFFSFFKVKENSF